MFFLPVSNSSKTHYAAVAVMRFNFVVSKVLWKLVYGLDSYQICYTEKGGDVMNFRILIFCLLLLIPNTGWAEEANSPTMLYSETQRGRSETLESLANSYLNQTLDAIAKVINENHRKKTDTDAFYVGADYTACLVLAAFLDKDKTPKSVYGLAKKNFKYYYKDMQNRIKNLGIDNKTLAALLGIHARDYAVEILNEWDVLANTPD